MGLNAIVYRNRKHLELGSDDKAAAVLPQTGEVYFENNETLKKHQHQLRAVEQRLGNIAEISALKEEASRLIGPESVLIQKILFSETHSGDTIPLTNLAQLSVELDIIRGTGRESPQLQHFVAALEELVQAATDEGNPIVFV